MLKKNTFILGLLCLSLLFSCSVKQEEEQGNSEADTQNSANTEEADYSEVKGESGRLLGAYYFGAGYFGQPRKSRSVENNLYIQDTI
jgi:hypothetical protein